MRTDRNLPSLLSIITVRGYHSSICRRSVCENMEIRPPSCISKSSPVCLVQLLIANLDGAALVALVLEVGEDAACEDDEHEDVAWLRVNFATGERYVALRLTKSEVDDAACDVDEAGEEVDDELEDALYELRGVLDGALDEVEGGGEEGPDDLEDRADEVRDGGDDGRHGEFDLFVLW